MTRFQPTLFATATALCACAALQPPSQGGGIGTDDLTSVPTYWLGQHPPCAVQPLRAVQATSESDLRRAAVQLGGNAVMRVRSSVVWPERTRANLQMMLSPQRIYTGVAVRVAERCHA